MRVEYVACPKAVTMTIYVPLEHECPYRDETDRGHVTITWQTKGSSIELHSLREYLAGLGTSKISHEAITDLIFRHLNDDRGVAVTAVETTWDMTGMVVRCCTSAILAELP